MIGKTNAVSKPGVELSLVVSVTTGATVTATKGSKVVSGTASGGSCVLPLPEAGTWSVKATLNGETSDTKSVSVVDSYAVALTFFSATITVEVDSGASVTLKKGSTTVATKTSTGTAVFTVKETGTYTVEATKNGQTVSGSVNVVSGTTAYTLALSFVSSTLGQYDTMANRCAASDKFNADLHVPIHTNGCNGVASGTRIFCFSSDKDSAGYKAAKAVFDVLAPFTPGKSENIKEYPGLFEVRTPKAPTVYIEVDFHDVPAVAKWIIENAEGIGEKIAEGLCDALDVAYKAPDTNATDIPADGDTGTEATGKTLYRVQVGAFSVKENAENFLREVKALGLSNAFITEVKV